MAHNLLHSCFPSLSPHLYSKELKQDPATQANPWALLPSCRGLLRRMSCIQIIPEQAQVFLKVQSSWSQIPQSKVCSLHNKICVATGGSLELVLWLKLATSRSREKDSSAALTAAATGNAALKRLVENHDTCIHTAQALY